MKRRMLRAGCAGRMAILVALPLALSLVFVAQLTPVAAQTVMAPPGPPRMVAPDEVLALLRANGFNPLERPIRRGVTYALRAVDVDGEKVRVIVDARIGKILAVTLLETQPLAPGPGVATAPIAPGPNLRRLPNAPPPDADIMVEPPRGRPAGPPVVYEPNPPVVYGSRPPAPVPGPAAPNANPRMPDAQIIAPEPNPGGVLPPPPERFPQRVAPATELKKKAVPPRRAASAAPKSPPLPRPKPAATVSQPSPVAAPAPAATPAPPAAAQPSPADTLPN